MTTQTPVRRSLTVPGRPEQAAAARQFAARALGPRHPHAETAVLLVSELVTNSLRHSASSDDGGTITITVITGPGELVRVEVTDDGAATVPMVHPVCGEDEGGRGMQLVSALASAWNCRREGSRTTTWFELAPRPQRVGGRVGVAGLSGAPPPGTAGSAWPAPGRPARAEVLRGQEPPVTWPEVMPPGRALEGLRTELAARGRATAGMTITRLQGILTLAGGPGVGYSCGWLFWPAGRLSRGGRPLYAVHRAGDPAGAARRLALPWPRDR